MVEDRERHAVLDAAGQVHLLALCEDATGDAVVGIAEFEQGGVTDES